jgi:prepilin-type N-terminal cleavage/methylation domain-containing protein
MKKTKGFTLIEMIVVVAIIAILMGIVITKSSDAKAKSRDAKRISDIANMQLSLELYFDRCNQYPALTNNPLNSAYKIPDLNSGSTCPSGITLATFLGKVPTPPLTGEFYEYSLNTNSTDYVLKAMLEKSNPALTDIDHTKTYSTSNGGFTPTVNCTYTLAYCVLPR